MRPIDLDHLIERMTKCLNANTTLTTAQKHFIMFNLNLEPTISSEITSSGNWVQKEVSAKAQFIPFECSNCGKLSSKQFDYCPHCGSKMY